MREAPLPTAYRSKISPFESDPRAETRKGSSVLQRAVDRLRVRGRNDAQRDGKDVAAAPVGVERFGDFSAFPEAAHQAPVKGFGKRVEFQCPATELGRFVQAPRVLQYRAQSRSGSRELAAQTLAVSDRPRRFFVPEEMALVEPDHARANVRQNARGALALLKRIHPAGQAFEYPSVDPRHACINGDSPLAHFQNLVAAEQAAKPMARDVAGVLGCVPLELGP